MQLFSHILFSSFGGDLGSLLQEGQFSLNPILTGLFESKFLLGGGGSIWPPLQISAPEGPIAAKFCMDVKTHVKSIATTFFWRKTVYAVYDLCKLDA